MNLDKLASLRRWVVLWFAVGVNFTMMGAARSIRQPIDESSLVTLSGNVHPLAAAQYDRGAADLSIPADRMLLVLKRNPQQDTDLQQFLNELHDKNSASYHKWLTPSQYGERFGAAAEDIQVLTIWLEGHGLKVVQVNPARTTIEFSGTVGQLQDTFHTAMHRYIVNGQQHVANASDPKIPAAIAPVVAGLSGLNDFFPSAQHTMPVRAAYEKATHLAKPEFTTAAGGKTLYVGPSDAATIYDTPNALNANFKGTRAYTGTGVTIGVISDANINTADVDTYRSFFGLPANTPSVIIDGANDPGVDTSTTGHTQQALMDVEVAGALAPAANVILYTAKDTALGSGLNLAMSRALSDNKADILEFGFSACEASLGAGGNALINSLWAEAAVQGVTVAVASGDSGAAGCDVAGSDAVALDGLGVNGYASTIYDIAVGGTDYDTLPTTFSQYVGGNGIALGYIPESPWNNSVALGENEALANNTAYKDQNGATNIYGGGGGASSCTNGASGGSSCVPPSNGGSAGYAKPQWQWANTNLNIPVDGVRDLPDVSLLAGTGQYGASWAVCGNDYDAAGNSIADCTGGGNTAQIQGIGGTSASASAFAGILALVAQSQGGRLGQADYVLYKLANQTNLYSSIFHDIQNGNNSVVCAGGTANCGTNEFLTGYNAGTAFDQASGLGSVDASALITNWSGAIFAPSTTSLAITAADGTPAPSSVPHGTMLKYVITVTGAEGTPAGLAGIVADVDETSNSYGDDFGFLGTLSHGTVSATVPDTPGGTFKAWGRYAGDMTYSASQSAPVQLTITPENSTLNLALYTKNANGTQAVTAPGTTYPYGSYLAVEATPVGVSIQTVGRPVGIATGTVTFQDNLTTLPTGANNLNNHGYAEIPVYYWSAGGHSITASYGGDNSFNPSRSTAPVTFSITQASTGLTLSAAPASLISGTVTVTGTVAPVATNPGSSPSGTVTLVDSTNGASLGSAAVVAGKNSAGGSIATFTITLNASSLAAGANTLTANYPGDGNYTGASGTAIVTRLPELATQLTLAATPAALQSGTTTVSGQVVPSVATGGVPPAGSVALTNSSNGAALGSAVLVPGTDANGNSIATFTLTVNASSLILGANTLTAAYPGGLDYAGATGTTVVTLNPVPPGSQFAITATNVTISSPGQTTGNTSTVTVTPNAGFAGQVDLTTSLLTAPADAQSPPTVTLSSSSVTLSEGTPGFVTATVATTALTYANRRPSEGLPRRGRWYSAGGAALACVLLLGIPARRRSWRAMLGLLLFVAVGMSVGCGVHLNQIETELTTPGTYVFTVSGVDGATGKLGATGTITVVVK